jgi:hypothetical protein
MACEERGLSIEFLEPYGGGPDVLVDLFLRAAGGLKMEIARLLAPTALWLVERRPFRKLAAKSAEKLPLGYVLVARRT